MWKSDLRAHDGCLSDRLLTPDASDAEAHFRRLLARDDLVGRPVAARIVSPITRHAIYFSRFDRDLGDGRIHPAAPLDLTRLDDGSAEATAWRPPASWTPRDWEADDQPFPVALTEWRKSHGWSRDDLARELRAPRSTLDGWLAGKTCSTERAIRRLMTLLDRMS